MHMQPTEDDTHRYAAKERATKLISRPETLPSYRRDEVLLWQFLVVKEAVKGAETSFPARTSIAVQKHTEKRISGADKVGSGVPYSNTRVSTRTS